MFHCLFSLIACNGAVKNQEQSQDNSLTVNTENPKQIKKKEPVKINQKWRSQALTVLDYRIKNEPKTYAIIDADILEYKHVFDGSRMSRPEEQLGNWIDFKEDYTYDYGTFSNTEGSGRYHYSLDKSLLIMIDDDDNTNPQEWEIKNAGDIIIMVGSHTYKNNAFQMKLERVKNKPTK